MLHKFYSIRLHTHIFKINHWLRVSLKICIWLRNNMYRLPSHSSCWAALSRWKIFRKAFVYFFLHFLERKRYIFDAKQIAIASFQNQVFQVHFFSYYSSYIYCCIKRMALYQNENINNTCKVYNIQKQIDTCDSMYNTHVAKFSFARGIS